MAKEDEEKIAFITSQGIFCYSKMPFGLKNARATYQRLVDKAFQKQIGRNLEAYVEDNLEDTLMEDIWLGVITFTVHDNDFSNMTGFLVDAIRAHCDGIMHDSKTFNNVFYALKEDLIYATEFKIQEAKELKEKSISATEVLAVVEEEGDTWMTPIFKYLSDRTFPAEGKKARPVKCKSWREIISDNGKQFQDNSFKDWCKKLCIHQHFASVKHPQTNGLVERANCSLGEGIKARLDERSKNWMVELPHVLWAHHTMIKSSNGDTPFSLTYKTEAVIPAEIGMPTLRTAEVNLEENKEALEINLDLLEEQREQAAIREAKSKAKMERYYNSKAQPANGSTVTKSEKKDHSGTFNSASSMLGKGFASAYVPVCPSASVPYLVITITQLHNHLLNIWRNGAGLSKSPTDKALVVPGQKQEVPAIPPKQQWIKGS
ncbi:reverse transcriptase domain-containing protein [Tanacetum coccineum]